MTPVQRDVIPHFVAKHDVCVSAPTGSGKTLAFIVPMLQLILNAKRPAGRIHGLVLASSRVLATQIADVADQLISAISAADPTQAVPIHVVTAVGGNKDASLADMVKAVERGPACAGCPTCAENKGACRRRGALVIGTPGRTLELLGALGNKSLSDTVFAVLDEADCLLGAGGRETSELAQQTRQIISRVPSMTHRGVFSATLSALAPQLGRLGLRNPVEISVTSASAPALTSEYVICDPEYRMVALAETVSEILENGLQAPAQPPKDAAAAAGVKAVCFCLTRDVVNYYARALPAAVAAVAGTAAAGRLTLTAIHGGLNHNERAAVVAAFNAQPEPGHLTLLLATDVLARGFDEAGIDLVLQMDAPQDPAAFFHRAGRTARIGRPGQARLFVARHEMAYIDVLRQEGAAGLCERRAPRAASLVAPSELIRAVTAAADTAAVHRKAFYMAESTAAARGKRFARRAAAAATTLAEPPALRAARAACDAARADMDVAESAVRAAHAALQDLLFPHPVCEAARATAAASREVLEASQNAYRSWIAAYSQNRSDYVSVFDLTRVDLGQLAIGLGLLALPARDKMKELKEHYIWFKTDETVVVNEIPYTNSDKEASRRRRVAAIIAAREAEAAGKATRPEPVAHRRKATDDENENGNEAGQPAAGAARAAPAASGDDWRAEFESLGSDLKQRRSKKSKLAKSGKHLSAEERRKARLAAKKAFDDI